MKKGLKIILTSLILCILLVGNVQKVHAATGYFSISSSSTVTVGNTFSVTIKATGSKIFYWQFYVSYDASKLKLVSGSATIQGEASDATYGTNVISKTLRFKALNTGSAYVSVARGDAAMNIDTNFNSVAYSSVKKTINIVPVVPKSSNNKLASLTVDGAELSPAFNADVTSYTIEFEPNTKEININATTADSKATVSGIGKIGVVEGTNNIKVVVTAENGSTKTYVIDAIVKEFEPIQVTVGGVTYNIVRKKGQYEPPANFSETTITMGTEKVLAYANEHIGNVVGLKDTKGNIVLHLYNGKNDTYTPYDNITINNLNLYLKKLNDPSLVPFDYKRTSITINDKNLNAWHYKNNDNYYLIYGVNTLNGDETFYLYDKERDTIQRFYNNQVTDMKEQLDKNTLVTYITSGTTILFVVISLFLSIKLLRRKKQPISTSPLDVYLETTNNRSKHKKRKQ